MEGEEHEAVGGEFWDPEMVAQPWLLLPDAVSWPSLSGASVAEDTWMIPCTGVKGML